MFFQKLLTLLATCQSLSIVMEQKEDTITLSVSLKYGEGKDDKDKLPPIVMSGTAQQLDEGFVDAFAKLEKESGLLTNIDMFLSQVKELEKKVTGKTTKPGKVEPVKSTAPTNNEAEGSDNSEENGDALTDESKSSTEPKIRKPRGTKETTAPKEQPKIEMPADLFNSASVEPEKQTVNQPATQPAPEPVQSAVQTTTEIKTEPKPKPVVSTSIVEPTMPVKPTAPSATDEDDIF